MKLKIIFLDVDGVLRSATFLKTELGRSNRWSLDPNAIEMLKWAFTDDNIKIVLSSSWKHDKEGLRILTNAGIPIYDLTPDGYGAISRGEEINRWVLEHEKDIYSFVIVDDNADILPQQFKRLVQTSFRDGLMPVHVQKIRRILCCPLNSPVIS